MYCYQIEKLLFKRSSADTQFILKIPCFQVVQGEKVALLGPSGCGKSTLLDLLSLIAMADSVRCFDFSPVDDVFSFAEKGEKRHELLAQLRRRYIGYVLQTGGLLGFLTVIDNIRLSQVLTGRDDRFWLEELVDILEIKRHLRKKPAALSTGERQRVAVARALAHHPSVVIADEPTAALDPENADKVLLLLVTLAERIKATLILATHDAPRLQRFNFSWCSQFFDKNSSEETVVSVFKKVGRRE